MEFNNSKCQFLPICISRYPIHLLSVYTSKRIRTTRQIYRCEFSNTLSWNSHIDKSQHHSKQTTRLHPQKHCHTKMNMFIPWRTKHLSALNLSMPHQFGDPMQKMNINTMQIGSAPCNKMSNKLLLPLFKCYPNGNKCQAVLQRSLERLRNNTRCIIFYRIDHNLIALELPQYRQSIAMFTHARLIISARCILAHICFLNPLRYIAGFWSSLSHHIVALSSLDSSKLHGCIGIN